MVSLAFASLVTWTIFFAKTLQLSHAQARLRRALARVAEARTLSEAQKALDGRPTALSALVRAALHEVRLSGESASDAGIKERSASRFTEIARAEARSMRFGMAMLATIGATAPFVGLFGTVWGIMNSFIGISKAQTTNLAVVAPGIAEALLATAIGLVAAIGRDHLQPFFARNQSLSGIRRPRLRRGRPPVVARSRPVAPPAVSAGGGVGRWRLFSAIPMTMATNSARRMTLTSRPSSTSCWCCSSSS
jgi:tonB-system energizer ExbB